MARNQLRRLSVALRLQEAYQPSSPVFEPPTASNSLGHFLATSKAEYLKDLAAQPPKGGEWTVVMGNEAGDLDSIASAIGYAWILSTIHKQRAVPLVQVERQDLILRAENLYTFSSVGLSEDQSELLTLTDLQDYYSTNDPSKPFPSHTFALVDHNRLGSAFTVGNPSARVVAILDHHEDENQHTDANPRTIITPCGSCASIVATLLPSSPSQNIPSSPSSSPNETRTGTTSPCPDPQHPYPRELATLLLSAILIDTNGLKPGGKATPLDQQSALTLAFNSTYSNRIPPPSALCPIGVAPNPDALYDTQAMKDLNALLQDKKADVSHLTAVDLLRRDYKEYSFELSWVHAADSSGSSPTIKAGLATVPLRLKDWGKGGKLERASVEWMQKRNLTVLGVLTSFKDKKEHKRETAWIVLNPTIISPSPSNTIDKQGQEGPEYKDLTPSSLSKRLWQGLEAASDELALKKHKKFELEKGDKRLPKEAKARVYKQGNAKATRKAIAPILKTILEGKGSSSSPEEGDEKKGKEVKEKGKKEKEKGGKKQATL